MKHAFLICAHNNLELLKSLILQLDYPGFDCFIHLDKKVGNVDCDKFTRLTRKSKVYLLADRIDVKWGNVTQIKSTFKLLHAAILTDDYDYLHLISGVDFPIKSNQYIYNFFQMHNGKEFVGFTKWTPMMDYKMGIYHFFSYETMKKHKSLFLLNKFIEGIQKVLRVPYFRRTKRFMKGCNWWSITGKLGRELLLNEKKILHDYKYSHCGDEIFLQTFIWNIPYFRNHIYNKSDEYKSCLRLIDWERGNPYVWKTKDVDIIMKSEALFARKFDSQDLEIIKKIQLKINN